MSRRRPGATKKLTTRFGIYLDPETRTALLQAAIEAGTSATALVEALIREYLRRHQRRKGRAR